MKRLFTALLLTLSWALMWADSPLTSTDFAENYKDHPMVQMALNLHGDDADPYVPVSILDFLANKKSPIDVRLAVINAISWNFEGKSSGEQLYEYLSKRYKAKTTDKLVKKLDAGTLAVYAYAKAMSDYFDVKEAQELGHKAVKKDKSKSFSVAFITSLIDAQVYLDSDWGMVYKVVNNVLHDGSLHLDMRQDAIDSVMEYINEYKGY
ncbi:MAG: hypothetical protein IKP41_08700 [Bacteroidaceae bacterium]|nr:hypothetical protein [Bacteroidaceae bacterium]